jgi:hypothetical protein
MSTYKDHWYDVTVECDVCHDMFECEIQLYTAREVALVKRLIKQLFTRCPNCGADGQELFMTVFKTNDTEDEVNQFRLNDNKWIFLYRRWKDKKDIL